MNGWLLFLYQLPVGRSAARLRLWRQLRKTGAVPFKSSTYLLPDAPEHYERLQWLAQQARGDGADATILRVREIEGSSEEQIIALFHAARVEDYQAIATAVRAATKGKRGRQPRPDPAEMERWLRQFEEVQRIDFFDSPAGTALGAELSRLVLGAGAAAEARTLDVRRFRGRTWLTRPRPHIDRAASAWLIRRFIDPEARFVFAATPAAHPEALPFDMFEGDFTHQGEDCTFETLLRRFALREKALRQIAEMVHEADIGDGKFAAAEGRGLDLVLKGWGRTSMSDDEIIERGLVCFDGLYQELRK